MISTQFRVDTYNFHLINCNNLIKVLQIPFLKKELSKNMSISNVLKLTCQSQQNRKNVKKGWKRSAAAFSQAIFIIPV